MVIFMLRRGFDAKIKHICRFRLIENVPRSPNSRSVCSELPCFGGVGKPTDLRYCKEAEREHNDEGPEPSFQLSGSWTSVPCWPTRSTLLSNIFSMFVSCWRIKVKNEALKSSYMRF